MRRCLIGLFVLATVACFSTSHADDASRRRTAEELLLQMQIDKNMDQLMSQVVKMQKGIMKGMGDQQGKEDLREKYNQKIMELMRREMSWEKMKEGYIDAYSEVFTEEEMKGLIIFYNSPIGMKFVEKSPALAQKAMEIGLKSSMKMIPEIKKLTDEMIKEMEAKGSGKK